MELSLNDTKSLESENINYSIDLLQRDENDRTHIVTELIDIKREYSIQDCTVLEVGCGFGNNLKVFDRDNITIGVEGLPSAVAEARARGSNVQKGNLEDPLELESESVDWVLCLDVLEHLVNSWGLLIEMRRVLRNGGKAIINVPNHFTLSGRIRLLFGHNLDVCGFFPGSHDWDNPHLRFFTYRGICEMARASGFKIVENRSEHSPAFPRLTILQKLGLDWAVERCARLRPSLFAAGFFLILEKS